jgi:hypothetical protein
VREPPNRGDPKAKQMSAKQIAVQTPPLPRGTDLQSLYSCRITSAPGQRPVQQPQQLSWTIRAILAASQSIKSRQATIRSGALSASPVNRWSLMQQAFRCGGYGECHCLTSAVGVRQASRRLPARCSWGAGLVEKQPSAISGQIRRPNPLSVAWGVHSVISLERRAS